MYKYLLSLCIIMNAVEIESKIKTILKHENDKQKQDIVKELNELLINIHSNKDSCKDNHKKADLIQIGSIQLS